MRTVSRVFLISREQQLNVTSAQLAKNFVSASHSFAMLVQQFKANCLLTTLSLAGLLEDKFAQTICLKLTWKQWPALLVHLSARPICLCKLSLSLSLSLPVSRSIWVHNFARTLSCHVPTKRSGCQSKAKSFFPLLSLSAEQRGSEKRERARRRAETIASVSTLLEAMEELGKCRPIGLA